MSSWMRILRNKFSLFSSLFKKERITDGKFLTFTWLIHFKMCLHRRIHIYIYILLSIEWYKSQYNAQHSLYTSAIVNKTWQRKAVIRKFVLDVLCYVCVPNIVEFASWWRQLELGSPALMLEPLKFVSGECDSSRRVNDSGVDHHSLCRFWTQLANKL